MPWPTSPAGSSTSAHRPQTWRTATGCPTSWNPLQQYAEHIDGRRPNADTYQIPKAIRPRPYPKALATVKARAREALRFAGELTPRIRDVFCIAARIELAIGPGDESRDDLFWLVDELGAAVAILFRQILAATPYLTNFTTMATVKGMLSAGGPPLTPSPLVGLPIPPA